MVAKYVATRTILDLCERSVRMPIAWVSQRWWEKEELNLAGARQQAPVRDEDKRRRGAGGDGDQYLKAGGIM